MTNATALPAERTVLFADMAGSTQLYEQVGDSVAFELVDRCLQAIRAQIELKGGRVVKHTGDGLMAVFAEADRAADASGRIQKVVRELPLSAGNKIAVRIGFHAGPVVESAGDVFGETVNIAARLLELASPGRAITSAETARQLAAEWQPLVHPLPPRTLRGVTRPIALAELVCEAVGDATLVQTTNFAIDDEPELRLYLGTQTAVLDTEHPNIHIGRDASAQLRVSDTRASRQHARIELRGDKFVLVDRSSNGTFVAIEGEKEFLLSREEVVLRGRGRIALGGPCPGNPQAITFVCL